MKRHLFILFVRICFTWFLLQRVALAQVDPHFSQYYNQPMALNPALTGAIDGDYRVSAIWRNQYGNTLNTKGVSGEVVTDKNTNFGLNILNESTSDHSYNYTNAYFSFAYTGVRFGENFDHYLVLAMQAGFMSRQFDISKLQFGDQWISGLGYDAALSSGELFSHPTTMAFDGGLGIAYYDAVPDKQVSWFGGFSVFHITTPQDPFVSGDGAQAMPLRYTVHGGAKIVASDVLNVVPSFVYMREGDAEEKMIGSYFQLYADETTDLIFGANWRIGDAVAPFAGFYRSGFTLGISYDVSVSNLSASASRSGSLEVSLSYVGFGKNGLKTKSFYCPRF